jgi:hypothetical protein
MPGGILKVGYPSGVCIPELIGGHKKAGFPKDRKTRQFL